MEFTKRRKEWVAKRVLDKKSYTYLQQMMLDEIMAKQDGETILDCTVSDLPKNIAT
jgi:hypothetical protein